MRRIRLMAGFAGQILPTPAEIVTLR